MTVACDLTKNIQTPEEAIKDVLTSPYSNQNVTRRIRPLVPGSVLNKRLSVEAHVGNLCWDLFTPESFSVSSINELLSLYSPLSVRFILGLLGVPRDSRDPYHFYSIDPFSPAWITQVPTSSTVSVRVSALVFFLVGTSCFHSLVHSNIRSVLTV